MGGVKRRPGAAALASVVITGAAAAQSTPDAALQARLDAPAVPRLDQPDAHASVAAPGADLVPRHGALAGDVLRWWAVGRIGATPHHVTVASVDHLGEHLDERQMALEPAACPADVTATAECRATAPLALVTEREPAARSRTAIVASVGGRLRADAAGALGAELRVGGPRAGPVGPLRELRARLNVHLVRAAVRGMPPLGGNDEAALAMARDEITAASKAWQQCGLRFEADPARIRVVDPPPPHLVAIGCGGGTPSSGGRVALRVDGQDVVVSLRAGLTPLQAARRLAGALRAAQHDVTLSPNPTPSYGALPSVDLLLRRRRDGGLATVEVPSGAPLSTDATLGVCIGTVDLADGLTHFSDYDAAVGTLEERTLLKALDDGDPTTLEVVVIPAFGRAGRIGESFIDSPEGSIENFVVIDRMGVRARRLSSALAHELGHILLDVPGHPDDYGVDTPWSLMDSDAADATLLGPRRLTLGDCTRMLQQSGPGARHVVVEPVPDVAQPRRTAR